MKNFDLLLHSFVCLFLYCIGLCVCAHMQSSSWGTDWGSDFFLFNRQRERVLNMVWFKIPAVNKHMMSAESVLTPPCLV